MITYLLAVYLALAKLALINFPRLFVDAEDSVSRNIQFFFYNLNLHVHEKFHCND